jgi:hypothetical protein
MPKDGLVTKYFRFKAVAPGTLTEEASSGYGDITIEMDGNDIKLTSDGEFNTYTWADDNQNSSHSYVDANTFIFTPYPYLDWGTIVGEVWEK